MNKARQSSKHQNMAPEAQRNTVLVAKEFPIDFTQDGMEVLSTRGASFVDVS
jgi:hypothetical protein